MPMTLVWGVIMIAMLIAEAVTVGLVTIWFALGALCALVSALLGAPLWLQIVWFAVISAATLILTRPLAKKYVNGRSQPTNADRVIGRSCVVTERIDNLAETGAVSVDGKVWTARSENGHPIEQGAVVVAKQIQGVKLIVSGKTSAN